MRKTIGKKSPGWAAVDLKLRHGVGEPDLESDPYPPVQNGNDLLRPSQNVSRSSTRPMSSSIIIPSSWTRIPTATKEIESEIHREVQVSRKNNKGVFVDENVNKVPVESLMKQYSTADPNLLEDILLAMDNDFDSASRVLDEMYQCRGVTKQEGASSRDPDSSSKDWLAYSGNGFESSDELSVDNALASVKNSLENLKLIPTEPEWEEDNVYLSRRKDAIKLMRSAAQHSRMASSAFLERDHYAAKQHSLMAREDWLAANNLNAKAAKEILLINNEKNDIWKFDLHGLHAVEAIKALQNHLTMIESQSSLHRSVSPKRVSGCHSLTGSSSSSSESLSCMVKDTGPKPGILSRQRTTTLQVITGKGLHSKGQAALPAAVRGFLDENGYRYDETRPGVINVRPKFGRGRCVPQ